MVIRDATSADSGACAEIYAPYVRDTAISFETEPPSADEMARRIADAQERHAWLVAEDDEIVGYAYGHPFAGPAAYRWSCTTSIYVTRDRRGTGVGRALYTALLDRLTDLGYRRAFAGIALPNDASAAIHRAFGFTPVGVYERVGWKHGQWRDVKWFQRTLSDQPPTDG